MCREVFEKQIKFLNVVLFAVLFREKRALKRSQQATQDSRRSAIEFLEFREIEQNFLFALTCCSDGIFLEDFPPVFLLLLASSAAAVKVDNFRQTHKIHTRTATMGAGQSVRWTRERKFRQWSGGKTFSHNFLETFAFIDVCRLEENRKILSLKVELQGINKLEFALHTRHKSAFKLQWDTRWWTEWKLNDKFFVLLLKCH